MTTVFISGSRRLSRLPSEVQDRIDNIVDRQLEVLVGDANGIDKAVQAHLGKKGYQNVVIFCSGDKCRNNVMGWKAEYIQVPPRSKGREFFEVKDRAMAVRASHGFVVWDGKSKGSIKNVLELLKLGKSSVVYFSPDKQFHHIKSKQDAENLLKLFDQTDRDALAARLELGKQLATLQSLSSEPHVSTDARSSETIRRDSQKAAVLHDQDDLFGSGVDHKPDDLMKQPRKKSASLNLSIPQPLLDALKAKAAERGIPYQRLIREAIEKAL